jgi:hypothetical protein
MPCQRVSYQSPCDRSDIGFLGPSIGYSVGERICPQELCTILSDLSNNLFLRPVNVQQVSIRGVQRKEGSFPQDRGLNIRSLSGLLCCHISSLVSLSNLILWPLCPGQWIAAICCGSKAAFKRFKVSLEYLIGDPSAVSNPHSFRRTAWACRTKKAHLESG